MQTVPVMKGSGKPILNQAVLLKTIGIDPCGIVKCREIKKMKRFINLLVRGASALAAIALVAIVLLIAISSAARFFIGFPVPDAEAISEMILVAVALLPLAAAQRKKEHVEVTVFTSWLVERQLVWVKRFGCFVGVVGFGILAYALALAAIRSFETNDSYLGVNMIVTWPARTVAVLAVLILVVQLIYEMFSRQTSEPAD